MPKSERGGQNILFWSAKDENHKQVAEKSLSFDFFLSACFSPSILESNV